MATKHQALWAKARKLWIKENEPTHEGYWYCVRCGKALDIHSLTVDHIISRSRAPELRYVQSNLQPMCWTCNGEKGST